MVETLYARLIFREITTVTFKSQRQSSGLVYVVRKTIKLRFELN